MGNIQFSRQNLAQLSVGVQTQLKAIASKDGDSDNLSGIDLSKATSEDLDGLLTELKEGGFSEAEQKLVDTIFELTQQSRSSIQNKGVKSFAFEGTDEAISLSFSKLKEGESVTTVRTGLKKTQEALVDKSTLVDNAPEVDLYVTKLKLSPVTYDISKDRLTGHGALRKMRAARKKLKETYKFEPTTRFDFKSIEAMKGKIPPKDVPKFIEAYMTANYEHPGGAEWAPSTKFLEESHSMTGLFFGNPPPLGQLPDGRCMIDCQGYAAVAETMFNALMPAGKDQGDAFMIPVRYPGHEMGIMRVGDDAYIVDNEKVNPLPLTDKELRILEIVVKGKEVVDNHLLTGFDLDEFKMSKSNFPTLYDYLKDTHPRLHAKGKEFEFDEDDALIDG